MKKLLAVMLHALVLAWGVIINGAFADDLEKGLQSELRDSRTSIVQAAAKLRSGASPAQEISRLKSIAEEIRASHLLMQERFRQQGEKASALGTLAVERQNAAAAEYGKALDEFLSLIDALPPEGTISQATLDALTTLLGKIIPRKSRPILGTLPYKHLGYPAREPATAPVVVPAYRGGNRIVAFADTASSAEAPISDEIVALAQSLQWKPVLIYEWVKNNVETEWYWGVMKGAEETLRQKSGNDADQAALLLALLRASGFPSRFVKGTIEFFPDIEKVKNLTGIDDPMRIAAFFQKAGIPFKPVIAGGKIANFQVEHIWVESEIPYSNYRGVVIDDFGKTWLALDTSIKPHGFTRNEPLDLPNSSFDTLRDEYLQNVHTVTPLEFLRSRAEEYLTQNIPGKTYQDLLSTKAIIPDVLKILPASLQFRQIAITGEFTELPAELRHQVRFTATGPANDNLLTVTLDAMRLSNQRVVLSYEPETVEDQQIIDSYGGFDNTPSYLVRLRPVLKLNGERLVVAQDGLPMGTDYTLAVEVITPNGTERISNRHIVGNLAVIGIVGQKALKPADIPVEEKNAERLLWEESLNYIDRWNQAEDELAALLKVAMARPLLTVVTVGGLIDVTYLLDIPHGFEWKGVFMDAALRRIETVTRTGDTARERSFMRLSALQGSILENRVFEDDFQVESVSTAKLLQLAATKGTQLFTIDKSNVDALLPTLPFDDAVNQDIASAVNQNLVVTIPRTEMTYRDWTGIGYVKENPASGESGWMLSGMVAGGDTADLPDKWAQWYLTQVLGSPYAKTNNDPRSAQRIIKVLAVDKQHTIVGRTTPEPLAVLVVDPVGLPVKGAMVTFKVVAGGGTFDAAGTAPEITVATGASGVAKAPFFVGRKTGDNAIYMMDQNGPNLTQVGLNLVTASVTGNYGTIQLADHFQAFGWPDVADHIEKVLPLDDSTTALANNPAGSIVAKVEDKYDNPVSNVSLTFTAMSAASKEPTSPLPAAARNIELYLPESCSVPYPLYGDCPTVTTLKVTTEYFGAVVNTILGNTVNTVYTVRVSAANVPSVKFTLSSEGYRNKTNDYIAPGLYIRSLQPVNERGQSINAAKAGSKLAVPLVSELFMLYDDVAPGGSGVTWSGIVKFKPIKDGTVNYEVAAGAGSVVNYANLGNGRYQAEYVTGAAPAVNNIKAQGAAEVTVPVVLYTNFIDNGTLMPSFAGTAPSDYIQTTPLTVTNTPLDCSSGVCKVREVKMLLYSGQQAIFFSVEPDGWRAAGMPQKAEFTACGVDIAQTTGGKVFLDKDGYSLNDLKITSTISPPEYQAIIADVVLYKDNMAAAYLAGETKGTGTVAFVRGSKFDIGSKYESQVILNSGSVVETRSDKKPIKVAELGRIEIRDENNQCNKAPRAPRDVAEEVGPPDTLVVATNTANKAYVLPVMVDTDTSINKDIVWRIVHTSLTGTLANGAIELAGADIVTTERILEIGIDVNQNGIYDDGDIKLKQFTIVIIPPSGYTSAAVDIYGGSWITNFQGGPVPLASSLLRTFVGESGSAVIKPDKVNQDINLYSTAYNLELIAGADFKPIDSNYDVCVAKLDEYVYTSQVVSDIIGDSNSIKTLYEGLLRDKWKRNELFEGDTSIKLPEPIKGDFKTLDPTVMFPPHLSDVHIAIGGHTMNSFEGKANVIKDSDSGKLCVESIQFKGEIVDLYDWNYWDKTTLSTFVSEAATVQLGWNSGLNGNILEKGKLFFTRFIFEKTKDLYEYRYDMLGNQYLQYSLCY